MLRKENIGILFLAHLQITIDPQYHLPKVVVFGFSFYQQKWKKQTNLCECSFLANFP